MLLALGALLGLVDHANWPTEAFGFSPFGQEPLRKLGTWKLRRYRVRSPGAATRWRRIYHEGDSPWRNCWPLNPPRLWGVFLCNTLQEASDSAAQTVAGRRRDFDVIVIGGGTFGAVISEHMLVTDRTRSRRILVLEAGPFVLP